MAYWDMSASEIAEAIKNRDMTCLSVTESCLSRIKEKDASIHAMLSVLEDQALKRASDLDKMTASGKDIGPLGGVPVVIKDNICAKGLETTCGSLMLKGWKPPYDGTVVRLLKEAGAVIVGKSNMDEFAMGGSTENSAFGVTKNPWNLRHVPGGSSGGSAASVAAGYVPVALGSDTGGSIRQPAAFCGVYGLKPTYGRVSRYGLVPFASSLDQIGPMARTVQDLARCMEILGVPDPLDSTSSQRPKDTFQDVLSKMDLKGHRIGVVKEISDYSYDEEMRGALESVVNLCLEKGAQIVPVSLKTTLDYGTIAYYILAPAEASSNLGRYDGVRYGHSSTASSLKELYLKSRCEAFGTEVKRRILTGAFMLASGNYETYFVKARKVRRLVEKEFQEAFKKADSIIIPPSPIPAYEIGGLIKDPVSMYMADAFTVPVNLAGLPGLSMNAGFSKDGLPLGVQFIGPKWGERELIGIAGVLERTLGPSKVAFGGDK